MSISVDQVIDISFQSPEDNLLFEEVLFNSLEKQGTAGNILRLWEAETLFIVLGRASVHTEDLLIEKVTEQVIPVFRRCSGGGTVLQGPGCLNYSLILSLQNELRLKDLRQSYQVILSDCVAALRGIGVEAFFRPICDLAFGIQEQKFSGNAQKRGKKAILHHGTILYNFNLDLISQYLALPKDKPEYRRERAHRDFVANLRKTNQSPVGQAELKAVLISSFASPQASVRRELNPQEETMLKELRAQKSLKIFY